LGGYWLGQQPDSPDAIGWLSTSAVEIGGQVDRAVDAGRKELGPLFATAEPAAEAADSPPPPAQPAQPAAKTDGQDRDNAAVPPCW